MDTAPIISPQACIYRAPSILKRHNEAAFVPNAFSIGPFHHGKDNLKDAQRIKLKYLQGLLERKVFFSVLYDCIDAVKGLVDEARKCYDGEIGMSDDDFIEMLVIDGCFIIELLRKDANVVPIDNDDPIFAMSCMLSFLYQDLLLLENQLPWFVLEVLFSLTGSLSESKSLTQLALEFLEHTFTSEKVELDVKLFANQEIKHILDLLRLSLVLPFELQDPSTMAVFAFEPLPPVTIMTVAGIKFMRVRSSSILDVKFSGGTIEMPSLLIQETLELILRNLISYEQCYPNCAPRVTCYAIILENLIRTTEDVDQLTKQGILINWLDPQDATNVFRKLHQDAYVTDLYYRKLCIDVKKYRQRWWPKWKVYYIRTFGKPWAIVSQVVAAVLLLLAFLQTMYTMKPDKK